MATQSVLSNAQILVIDDEPDLRTLYELTLLREGYRVDTAGSVQEAMQAIQTRRFDVVITDMRLPDGLGTEILNHMRSMQRAERCIVITAHGSAENAVESLKAGAFDYLTKPVDLKQFRSAIASAVHGTRPNGGPTRRATDTRPIDSCASSSAGQAALSRLAGESASMRAVKERVIKVARSMAPVLIQGESGTGKELVANSLHANSHRATGPWVAVNCSAIPEKSPMFPLRCWHRERSINSHCCLCTGMCANSKTSCTAPSRCATGMPCDSTTFKPLPVASPRWTLRLPRPWRNPRTLRCPRTSKGIWTNRNAKSSSERSRRPASTARWLRRAWV